MNKIIRHAAFVAGLAALVWVGVGYVGDHALALAITALIGAFYIAGAVELQRYQRATTALEGAVAALAGPPADLQGWLASVPAALRNTVRRRVEGEPVGFAGPGLAPYLSGLLVLLGMLGTFVGMVVTLRGTGVALDSATDLQAVRTSLVAPVQGLGLAFGTSIAGVAASAALGLMSALTRRDRARVVQALDARIATTLRAFSAIHRRETSLAVLQRQADLMPVLVDTLRSMMDAMERQGRESSARLLASQDEFHARATAAYTGLAASVDRSLRDSLDEGARIAGETIRPIVEATLAGVARETIALHTSLADIAQSQVDRLSTRFEASGARAEAAWDAALARHETSSQRLHDHLQAALDGAAGRFEQHSASLLRTIDQANAEDRAESAARDRQHVAAMAGSLEAMAATLRDEWQRSGAHTLDQQRRLGDTWAETARAITTEVETHTRGTLAEIGRLMQSAAEAPRAAAGVIAELREKLADSLVRDNALLDERGRMLDVLGTLQQGVAHAAIEQRGAIDALVESSAALLDRVGRRFGEQVDADAGRLDAAAAQVSGSAADVASLGASFGVAVQRFGESNDTLVDQLQRIERALDKSLSRSDEQLAYYVAQAREVVDLSILSQRQIIENLQRLPGRRDADEAAESAA